MSAIARLLLARGARVSGSDVRRTALIDELEREGARVAIGHRAENVGAPDLVVVSSAIAQDNPGIRRRARTRHRHQDARCDARRSDRLAQDDRGRRHAR